MEKALKILKSIKRVIRTNLKVTCKKKRSDLFIKMELIRRG